MFKFNHNETPNNCNCSPGDDDIVTVAFTQLGSNLFSVGGVNYTFGITGFQVGNVNFAQFNSPENQANSAFLRASFAGVETFGVRAPSLVLVCPVSSLRV